MSVETVSRTEPNEQVELLQEAHRVLAKRWLGEDFIIQLLLSTVLAKGHLLIVDIPGVGKTTLAKSLAQVLGLSFNRIQFTNDILPADILGGSVYHPSEGTFSFSPGPIFTDFLLADEINRAPTRSQSAFLQAMEEGFVAIDGVNHPLSHFFTVIATQNPIDFDSTNPLPEAQLDRFLTAISLGYPDVESELYLLNGYQHSVRNAPESVLNRDMLQALCDQCENVFIHPDLSRYIIEIARESRTDSRIKLGISPRGCMHLAVMAKAYALVQGRRQVIPEDIQRLIHPVWDHRLLPRHGRDHDGTHSYELLQEFLNNIPVPR
jgi:MoxR-like ATPase